MRIDERRYAETARDYARRVLKDNIVSMELEPGAMVSENELAAQMGLSRTPVREALMDLAKCRVVDVLPQRGSRIALIDYDLVDEARFAREVLETAILDQVCQRATAADISQLRQNIRLQMMSQVEDLYGNGEIEVRRDPLLITDAEKRVLIDECEDESDSEDVGGIDEYVYSAMDLPIFYDDPDEMLCEEIEDPYVLTPEENAIVNEMTSVLSNLMQERLSERERDILRRRTGMNEEQRAETLEEIADSYGLTRERIRQMEAKALNKLNHPSCARRIEDYLDNLG